jgi:uroporphyrin-III C-methyltransferase/precorrin-2 dehydrogenase/sirohydrochlorin ferrochelatase
VAYSVIPGITAGLGAAAQSEVPLTYRQEALRITFLTAHKAEDAGNVDWSALTDKKMTVVVYMGMTAARTIREGLLTAGRSPDTPVGVFARATRPDAKAVVGKLRDLPALAEQVERGPAILIIGDVVARSAPWRNANPDDLTSATENQNHRPVHRHRQPHRRWSRDLSHRFSWLVGQAIRRRDRPERR